MDIEMDKNKVYLPYGEGCFVCGKDNPHGLKVDFYVKENQVCVDLLFENSYQSYKNTTHGGILSAILDETMGWAAYIFSDITSFLFTRDLHVTYKRNAPIGEKLYLSTEFVGIERNILYKTTGVIKDSEGKIITTAKGIYAPTPEGITKDTKHILKFVDGFNYHPKTLKYCVPQQ